MSHGHLTTYEAFAERYFDRSDDQAWEARLERPFMVSRLGDLAGKTVMDLGCGSGFYSALAASRDASVIAVDVSEAALARTRRRAGAVAIQTVTADIAEPLRFAADESVDLIICSLVLHHVSDWPPVLAEFARVLRPTGTVLISTHHPFADAVRFNEDAYFYKRLVTDYWDLGETAKVRYFVRPLRDIVEDLLGSPLQLVFLDEPTCNEDFGAAVPEPFRRAGTRPSLLVAGLTKGKPPEAFNGL